MIQVRRVDRDERGPYPNQGQGSPLRPSRSLISLPAPLRLPSKAKVRLAGGRDGRGLRPSQVGRQVLPRPRGGPTQGRFHSPASSPPCRLLARLAGQSAEILYEDGICKTLPLKGLRSISPAARRSAQKVSTSPRLTFGKTLLWPPRMPSSGSRRRRRRAPQSRGSRTRPRSSPPSSAASASDPPLPAVRPPGSGHL